MNLLIEEFALQCKEYKLQVDGARVDFDYKKFAELLIRECADIAYKTSWDDLVHGYGQAVIPLHLHNTIKQHFGVEE